MELLFTASIIGIMVLLITLPLMQVLFQRLKYGSIMAPQSSILITATLLPIAYFLSMAFADDRSTALLGFSFNTDSFSVIFLGFLALLLTIFIAGRKGTADIIQKSIIKVLSAVSFLFLLQMLIQWFEIQSLSWVSFLQPIQSWVDVTATVSLLIIFFVSSRNPTLSEDKRKLLLKAIIPTSILMLFLGFFTHITSVFVLLFGIALFKIFWIYKTPTLEVKEKNHSILILPLLVLVISSWFIIDDFLLKGMVTGTVQSWTHVSFNTVRPNWQGTLNTAAGTIGHGDITSKLFGPGIGSFENVWRLYKPLAVNTTQFWNTSFTYAIGYVPTSVITGGAVMFAAWLLFLLSIIIGAFKSRASSLGMATLFIWLFAVVNPISILLLIIAFILTGLMIAESARVRNIRMINYKLKGHNKNKTIVFFILPGLFIASIVLISIFAHRIFINVSIMNASNAFAQGDFKKAEQLLARTHSFADIAMIEQSYTQLAMAKLSQLLVENEKEKGSVSSDIMQEALSNLLIHARAAITKDPRNPIHYTTLGNISEQLINVDVDGAAKTALEAYAKAVTLDPQNPALPLFIARVHTGLGDTDKAEIALEESLQLKSNFEPALYQYGLLKLSQKDTLAVIEILGTLVQINQNHANALYYLSLALADQKRFEEAFLVMQRVAILNPDNVDVQKLLVTLQEKSNLQKSAPIINTNFRDNSQN